MTALRLTQLMAQDLWRYERGHRLLLVGVQERDVLRPFAAEDVHIVQPHAGLCQMFLDAGFAATPHFPEGRFDAALVVLPRSKPRGRDWIGRASRLLHGPDATLMIDGAKTDGIESMLRAVKKIAPVTAILSKAHGKIGLCMANEALGAWVMAPYQNKAGYWVRAGVFCEDNVDAGSALLAERLRAVPPQSFGARVADLGAGWGYLSAILRAHAPQVVMCLVESDAVALEMAQRNLAPFDGADGSDAPQFIWQDLRMWQSDVAFDSVVMNPPFHSNRQSDLALGRAFIEKAAALLRPSGRLWMVANHHLPYRETLSAVFQEVHVGARNGKFCVYEAKLGSCKTGARAHRLAKRGIV